MQTLDKRKEEIILLMQYAVPQEQLPKAASLLEKYSSDSIALHLFHKFYSCLPEGLEDSIHILRLLACKEGTFLLCASTGLDHYLYLATNQEAEFVGPLAEGIRQVEVLDFFAFTGPEDFLARCADPELFPFHVPVHLNSGLCPVCHTSDGEMHNLGCPVEVCPWCGGQLTSCPCRFALLGKKTLTSERELDALLLLLDKKGRVPFNAGEHRPSYPLTPEDLRTPEIT